MPGAAQPKASGSLRPGALKEKRQIHPEAGCGLPEVKKTESGASFREKAGGRYHVCVYKQMRKVCLLVLLGQENAFVWDFVSGASVREEMAHLFINTNELVVFKNTILGVN